MLMALYNVSISLKGLKYLSENQELILLIWTLLDGEPITQKCLHPMSLSSDLYLMCLCDRWTVGGVPALPASPAVSAVRGRRVSPVGLLAAGSGPPRSGHQAHRQRAAQPETDRSADPGGPSGFPAGTNGCMFSFVFL